MDGDFLGGLLGYFVGERKDGVIVGEGLGRIDEDALGFDVNVKDDVAGGIMQPSFGTNVCCNKK